MSGPYYHALGSPEGSHTNLASGTTIGGRSPLPSHADSPLSAAILAQDLDRF